MKKRILSLIMAVCMVAVAVPSFLLPVVAEGTDGTFTTSFENGNKDKNAPLYTAGTSFDGFQNGWSLGVFQDEGSYSEMAGFYPSANMLCLSGSDQWSVGGAYLSPSNFSGALALAGVFTDGQPHNATVVTYTSPYEGEVSITFDLLFTLDAGTVGYVQGARLYMAVFINNEMVWPKAGGSYTSTSDWQFFSSEDASTTDVLQLIEEQNIDMSGLKALNVTRGDLIQIAVAKGDALHGNCAVVAPTLTYAAGYKQIPSYLKATYGAHSSGWPTAGRMNGIRGLEQTHASWKLGALVKGTDGAYAFTAYTEQYKMNTDTWAAILPTYPETDDTVTANDYRANGGILINSAFAGREKGSIMFPLKGEDLDIVESKYISAYQYVAEATGVADITLTNVALYDADEEEPLKNKKVNVLVLRNGKELLNKTFTADDKGAVTVDDAALKNVTIQRGDTISFAFTPVTGEDVKMVTITPTVLFTTIQSFLSEAYDAAKEVAVKVEATTLSIEKDIGVAFKVYGTRAVYEDLDAEVGVYVWNRGADKTDESAAKKYVAEADISYAFNYRYDDLVIKELGDDFTVQPYVTTKGTTYKGEQTTYNIAKIALEEYKATKSEISIALLNYGAAAQKYFKYNEDKLVNAELSDEDKKLNNDALYDAEMTATEPAGTACVTEIGGFSVIFGNTLSLRILVNVDASETDQEPKIWFSKTDSELDASKEATVTSTIDTSAPYYLVEDIGLNEMSNLMYMKVGAKPNRQYYYGYTISYSVQSYVARICSQFEAGTPESDLVRSMMELGLAVAAQG